MTISFVNSLEHQAFNFSFELVQSFSERDILLSVLVLRLFDCLVRLHGHRRLHVAALFSVWGGVSYRLLLLSCLLFHELHAAHLKLVDGGHVNLWQVVRLVAGIDIFGDDLRLLQNEGSSII